MLLASALVGMQTMDIGERPSGLSGLQVLVALQQAGQASSCSNTSADAESRQGRLGDISCLSGLQVLVALQQAGQASGSGTSARLDSLQGELGGARQTLAQLAQQHATEKASRLQEAAATAKGLQVGFPASCISGVEVPEWGLLLRPKPSLAVNDLMHPCREQLQVPAGSRQDSLMPATAPVLQLWLHPGLAWRWVPDWCRSQDWQSCAELKACSCHCQEAAAFTRPKWGHPCSGSGEPEAHPNLELLHPVEAVKAAPPASDESAACSPYLCAESRGDSCIYLAMDTPTHRSRCTLCRQLRQRWRLQRTLPCAAACRRWRGRPVRSGEHFRPSGRRWMAWAAPPGGLQWSEMGQKLGDLRTRPCKFSGLGRL